MIICVLFLVCPCFCRLILAIKNKIKKALRLLSESLETEAELQVLLALLPESKGGVSPLALGLFSTDSRYGRFCVFCSWGLAAVAERLPTCVPACLRGDVVQMRAKCGLVLFLLSFCWNMFASSFASVVLKTKNYFRAVDQF